MLLQVADIHTYYGKSHVLHGVSMEIEEGEIVALLGRNGVGKSTTLKSIIGMAPPQAGSIRLKGREITGLKPHTVCYQGVGYVPEERRIFPELTVRQNLAIGMKPRQKVDDPWTLERIYTYFPRLKERDRQKGKHLSGGEQQMLTMARTLIGNPELLLLDEPTEGLFRPRGYGDADVQGHQRERLLDPSRGAFHRRRPLDGPQGLHHVKRAGGLSGLEGRDPGERRGPEKIP